MSRHESFSGSTSSRALARALSCALACALASCAGIETAVPPVATLGKSTATLEAGRRIYLASCTHCHRAEPVRDFAAAKWPGIVADMGERAHLTAEQQRAVLAYALAAAR